MGAYIKSEFLKLFTIKSTYIILLISLLVNFLFSFYVAGWRLDPLSILSPTLLQGQVTSAVSSFGVFIGLIAILQVTHEYRYGTVIYTLTSSRSRLKSLVAKYFVVAVFAVVSSAIYGFLSPVLTLLATELRGLEMAPQDFNYFSLLWRTSLLGLAFSTFAFTFSVIIRNQVGAIALMFLMPSMIEPLLGLLLKSNVIYLPYNAANILLGFISSDVSASYAKGAVIIAAYIIAGWIISAFLFVRRDAN